MNKRKLIILTLIVSLCFPISTFAETIITKSGKTVEGKLIEKTDKYIKIDFQGVPLTYFFDEIESIDGKPLNHNIAPLISDESTDALLTVIRDLGDDFRADLPVSAFLADQLAPLYNKFNFKDVNNIDEVYQTLEGDACVVRKFIALADEYKTDSVQIHGTIIGPEAAKDCANIFRVNAAKCTEEQLKSKDTLFLCTFHSLVTRLVLEAKGLETVTVSSYDYKPIIDSLVPTGTILPSLDLDQHFFCLIRIGNKGIFYDPLNCFVSKPFVFAEAYQEIPGGVFKLVSNKYVDLFQTITIHDDRSALAPLYYNISHLFLVFENYEKSLFYAQKALTFSSDPFLYCHLGFVYSRLEDLDQAKFYLEKGLASLPSQGYDQVRNEGHRELGLVYAKSHQYEKSVENFEKALEIDPYRKVDIYLALAAIYYDLGRYGDAKQIIEKGMKLAQEQDNKEVYQELKSLSDQVYIK